MKKPIVKSYGKFVGGIVLAWFAFALIASDVLWFKNDANRLSIAVGLAAGTPVLAFAAWFAASEKFRKFALSLDPQILTLAQTWRIVGFTFVLLEARGVLPAIFAWPAGYGDMMIGATATFAAWKLANPIRRSGFILWQVLGITDLVTAVGLGTTARLLVPHGASMAAMTVLPLSLVPTFLVPLFLIFHLVCIAQARAWKASSGETVASVQAVQYSAI